jgi:glutamate-5-semialdehyde dehydrogenase
MSAAFDITTHMPAMGQSARKAAHALRMSSAESRADAIRAMADAVRVDQDDILSANAEDMAQGRARSLDSAMLDRLHLTPERLESIAQSLEAIAVLPDPLGRALESWTQPNGLHFRKVSVPIGVIGMIYESRPNVTADAGALCVKSGNAVILRSGSEALRSSRALHTALQTGLRTVGLPETAIQLVPVTDRAAVGAMLTGLGGTLDMIIPRGGKGLVARVQAEAKVPVLAHLDGLNTTYVHSSASKSMTLEVIANAKMRRTGVCGATETVLIDRAIAAEIVPDLVTKLTALGCEVRGSASARKLVDMTPASPTDFQTEHLAPILNLDLVDGLDAALAHIDTHGSGHTDAVICEDPVTAARFLDAVDSAIVMHNASTQFADGGEFGFGAEIGIATGRLHARGPVGAQHLVTHKYTVSGTGQTRP